MSVGIVGKTGDGGRAGRICRCCPGLRPPMSQEPLSKPMRRGNGMAAVDRFWASAAHGSILETRLLKHTRRKPSCSTRVSDNLIIQYD